MIPPQNDDIIYEEPQAVSMKMNMMINYQREVISIHIGQAGVQMGNAAWELYCLEHGEFFLSSSNIYFMVLVLP